jgi:hypothetical protein
MEAEDTFPQHWGSAGMFMDKPIIPNAINYVAIFVLFLSIAVLAPKRKHKESYDSGSYYTPSSKWDIRLYLL